MERPAWERLLPGAAALRSYERAWLPGDAVAGLTVAAYLVPQVMAYATVAGLPAVAGLSANPTPAPVSTRPMQMSTVMPTIAQPAFG